MRDALESALKCFQAAWAEGLNDRLYEKSDVNEPGSLADLVERRLLPAQDYIERGLTYTAPVQSQGGEPQAVTYGYAKGARWCQPGDRQDYRYYLVRFDDAERNDAVFTDGKEAREFWDRYNTSWNCYLFATEPLYASPPASPDGAVREALEDTIAKLEQKLRGYKDHCAELNHALATARQPGLIEMAEWHEKQALHWSELTDPNAHVRAMFSAHQQAHEESAKEFRTRAASKGSA